MSLKGFHILFITVSTLLALGIGAWCLWVNSVEGTPVFRIGAICSFVAAVALMIYGVWFYHMKTKLLVGFVLFFGSQVGQALACAVCYGAKDGKTTEHMAVAIWVLMGVVMSVMGGVGAFSFHLWRHANTPLEPHQELTDEDLDRYD
jgi:hypothetical protein